jgi:hypothetical protein
LSLILAKVIREYEAKITELEVQLAHDDNSKKSDEK